jgi:hypothetical protein
MPAASPCVAAGTRGKKQMEAAMKLHREVEDGVLATTSVKAEHDRASRS